MLSKRVCGGDAVNLSVYQNIFFIFGFYNSRCNNAIASFVVQGHFKFGLVIAERVFRCSFVSFTACWPIWIMPSCIEVTDDERSIWYLCVAAFSATEVCVNSGANSSAISTTGQYLSGRVCTRLVSINSNTPRCKCAGVRV